MAKEKKRTNARCTTLAVLKVLQRETNQTRPLHIAEIVERLKEPPYQITTNRDTVKRILNALQLPQFYEGKVICNRYVRGGEGSYTYGYWYNQPLPVPGAVSAFNDLTTKNIELLTKVIQSNKDGGYSKTLTAILFHMNGYGSDKRIHPKKKDEEYCILPVKIVVYKSLPYLVGIYLSKESPKVWDKKTAHIRIDVMDRLEEKCDGELPPLDEYQRYTINLANEERYCDQHFAMAYEDQPGVPPGAVIRVNKWEDRPDGSLTLLHDAFGESWRVCQEDDRMVEVEVRGPDWAIETFVWEHLDRVELLGPPERKASIDANLKERCESFLKKFDMLEICV